MFLWNMLGALVLLPALARFLIGAGPDQDAELRLAGAAGTAN